jgi:hypothetical protein
MPTLIDPCNELQLYHHPSSPLGAEYDLEEVLQQNMISAWPGIQITLGYK